MCYSLRCPNPWNLTIKKFVELERWIASECHLFYSHQDLTHRHFLKDVDDEILRQRQEKQLKSMKLIFIWKL